jgi:DNA (cytosine-5)-methyltransferase 1
MANQLSFIDAFAGAGGLSLGLLQAGWKGIFAIEKSPMAFETLRHNLIDSPDFPRFDWPSWLPQKATSVEGTIKVLPYLLAALPAKASLLLENDEPRTSGIDCLNGTSIW